MRKINIKEARIYWNDETGIGVAGTQQSPETRDSVNYPCSRQFDLSKDPAVNALSALGELLWLYKQNKINRSSLFQIIESIHELYTVCETEPGPDGYTF
jgi:hypothetical protein